LPALVRATVDTRGKQHEPKLVLAKPVLPIAGEYLHSRASKLSSFTHRPQTGNWRRRRFSLQTKKINGLHENDFIMATKIDRIFARTAAA
jgi:hypothetical protein